jgi:methyl-accepting chemotaxis protein
MDEMTQQNAALVEQAAAAAQSLLDQAQSLAASVSVFKLAHGAAAAPVIRKAPVKAPAPKAAAAPVTKRVAASGAKRLPPARPKGKPRDNPDGGDWEEF